MNYRTAIAGAIRDIAQPRAMTLAQFSAPRDFGTVPASYGIPVDVEVRMTRGMVDNGVAADPLYKATGGVTL